MAHRFERSRSLSSGGPASCCALAVTRCALLSAAVHGRRYRALDHIGKTKSELADQCASMGVAVAVRASPCTAVGAPYRHHDHVQLWSQRKACE